MLAQDIFDIYGIVIVGITMEHFAPPIFIYLFVYYFISYTAPLPQNGAQNSLQ